MPMNEPERKPSEATNFAVIALVTAVPIVALLWAFQPGNPYGYFVFLRFIVCACAFVFVAIFVGQKQQFLVLVFVFLALLYNPFIPVHLPRSKWLGLNGATIVAFVIGLVVSLIGVRRAAKSKS